MKISYGRIGFMEKLSILKGKKGKHYLKYYFTSNLCCGAHRKPVLQSHNKGESGLVGSRSQNGQGPLKIGRFRNTALNLHVFIKYILYFTFLKIMHTAQQDPGP